MELVSACTREECILYVQVLLELRYKQDVKYSTKLQTISPTDRVIQ